MEWPTYTASFHGNTHTLFVQFKMLFHSILDVWDNLPVIFKEDIMEPYK